MTKKFINKIYRNAEHGMYTVHGMYTYSVELAPHTGAWEIMRCKTADVGRMWFDSNNNIRTAWKRVEA